MEKPIGIIYAPIEIENPGQLETLGITWQDVVPIRIGKRVVKVYLAPAPEEVSRYMLRELRKKYQREYRNNRCRIPSGRGELKLCRSAEPCAGCPHYQERQMAEVSLDEFLEDGGDFEAAGEDPQEKMELKDLFSSIREEDPLACEVLSLKLAGYTEVEISGLLGLTPAAVHRAIERARRIAGKYMG